MSSLSSRRRRRLRRGGDVRPSANWAGLPIDALLSVLHKLDPMELMMGGAGRVCRSWRRAVRDEPVLWRRIDTRFRKGHRCQIDEDTAKEAVRRGSRRCEAFCGEDATDHFLLFLAEHAPTLKSLRLIFSDRISNEGLLKAINKFPVLEELELSRCKHVFGKVYKFIGIACPHLKSFRLSCLHSYRSEAAKYNKDEEAIAISTMSALRSLQLLGSELTNKGLTAILDNCTRLEYLDIRHCFNICFDTALRAKCARIKTMKLPHDSTADYDLEIGIPILRRSKTICRDYALWKFGT